MTRVLLVMTAAACMSVAGLARQTGARAAADWPSWLMRLDVMVSAADGRPVSDLTQSDFEIVSDGRPVPIARYSNNGAPLTVAVLVDVTASLYDNPGGVAGVQK